MYGRRSHIYLYIRIGIFLIFHSIESVDKTQELSVQYEYIWQRLHKYIYSYVIGLYLVSSLICLWFNVFEDRRVLESIPVSGCVIKSHTDLNSYLTWNSYLWLQIWNLALHPDYNRYKLTILILCCSNLWLYKP